jgi:hypothetical protein
VSGLRALRWGGALAAAGLWLLAGCTFLGDEVEIDPYRDSRPSAFVGRLREEIAGVQSAYHDMIVRATPQERRRLPSIDSELSRLADAAAALADDLSWQRGAFAQHLHRAESVAASIDQQLTGARIPGNVAHRWRRTREALADVRQLYSQLGQERLYREETERPGATRVPLTSPDTYDASLEVDQVRRGYDEVMKAWRDAPARRAAAPWPAELDRELAALRDPVAALGRADAKQRATVAPAADVVRRQVDRVRAIVEDHETELPRAMVEGWTRLSGWVRDLGK